ncbi:MAG: hypothetical protein KAG61_08645 [Bacteriovoracaceae bacterium]|nr:hypothetical protein [Bacteriovoracaceae bacterium]
MKKLTSLFIVITMSVFIASCGGGNASSSGSSSNGGNNGYLSNDCLKKASSFMNSNRIGSNHYVKVQMVEKTYAPNVTENTYLNDFITVNTNKPTIDVDSWDEERLQGEQDAELNSIFERADKCTIVTGNSYNNYGQELGVEIQSDNFIFHIDFSRPAEVNPVGKLEQRSNGATVFEYVQYFIVRNR